MNTARALPILAVLSGGLAGLAGEAPPSVVRWQADESTTVLLVEDDRVPVVELRLAFPVGDWSPWARENHADEAFRIQFHDPDGALRRRADALGIRPWFSVSSRSMLLSVSFLREDTEAVFELVRDILANRSFDRSELRRWRKERALGWKQKQRSPHFRLEQAARRTLFRPGDSRRVPWEKPPRVSTDVERLVATRDVILRLPGRQIGLAGNIDRATAEQVVENLLPPALERPPAGIDPLLLPPRGPDERPRRLVIPMRRLTQVYMVLGRIAPAIGDPDYPAFLVADHVLGGNFHSRLSTALRHEKGDTYGAGTRGGNDLVPEAYGLATFTRAPNAASAEATLREVLATFHENGITEEERALAAGFLVGRGWRRRASPGAVLAEAMWEQQFGLPRGYRDRLAAQAAALTLDEIDAFIRRFHDPERFGIVIARPR